jgi:hypothetical protein
MAFTRAYDDKDRVNMFLEQDVNNLKYMVNVPGNGTTPSYIVDPQIRLQKFGANISENMVDINSGLKGMNKTLSRDGFQQNNGRAGNSEPFNNDYMKYNFPTISSAITDQPRATEPAWALRGLEQNNWDYLHSNPQNNTERMFENNTSSRILEKDNYDNNCKIIK